MTDEEIDALLADFRALAQVPGATRQRIKDESTALETGKPRTTRSKAKVLAGLDDLL